MVGTLFLVERSHHPVIMALLSAVPSVGGNLGTKKWYDPDSFLIEEVMQI